MIGLRSLAVLAIWLCAATASAEEVAAIQSRYTYLNDCRMLDHGEGSEDWVFHRCKGNGSIPVWLRYTDSTRSWLGFGTKQNTSGMFSAQRDDAWPLEWRGLKARGSFEPFAVILRMRSADGATGSYLVIYRLRDDGSACIVGSTTASNDNARRIADAARVRFSCEQEPQLF